jgi:crotonobetainyl-CoA:carnitine CoA-transferase CaiB-like acyl-CoA transferase
VSGLDHRDRAALDLILQAESGMISVTGEEGGPRRARGTSVADLTAGMGEHTAEVLRELLGMSPGAVAALREQGAIGGLPRR